MAGLISPVHTRRLLLFSGTFVCRRWPTSSLSRLVQARASDAGGERSMFTSSIRCLPACSASSRCDTPSLISTWVMTCLTLQGRHLCSLSVTASHSRQSVIFICDRMKPVSRLSEVSERFFHYYLWYFFTGRCLESTVLVLQKLPVFHAFCFTSVCDLFSVFSERVKIKKV